MSSPNQTTPPEPSISWMPYTIYPEKQTKSRVYETLCYHRQGGLFAPPPVWYGQGTP